MFRRKKIITGAYKTNPIVQPDKRQNKTKVPLPDTQNVEFAKEFVDKNHK